MGQKPLCIDLFCGLGGWSDGFLAEGYDCVGFDIERHDYGTGGYPGQLVLQDVRTLHGSQFEDAAVIVASPPCQKYSYMAMPWSRAKAQAAEIRQSYLKWSQLNELFAECFRIAWEANVPVIVENVRGAQEWVGPAKWAYGSFYLWGDVPALMPMVSRHAKVPGLNRSGSDKPGYVVRAFNTMAEQRIRCICPKTCDCQSPDTEPALVSNACPVHNLYPEPIEGCKAHDEYGHLKPRQSNDAFKGIPHRTAGHWTNPAEHEGLKVPGNRLSENGFTIPVAREIDKSLRSDDWKLDSEARRQHLSFSRKAASAHIARIPQPLARHIARCFKDARAAN